MNFDARQAFRKLAGLVITPGAEPRLKALRIQTFQRDIVLPIKALLVLTLVYYFYFSNWIDQTNSNREVALETVSRFFLVYLLLNVAAGLVLIFVRRLPLQVLEWMIFSLGLLDAVLFASLTLVTGGFDSILYWIFLALIIHNAISIPVATPQIILNLLVCLSYVMAGALDVIISGEDAIYMALDAGTRHALDLGHGEENTAEPFLLRVIVLVLMTVCCYGLQSLFEKQRLAEEEAKEFLFRQEQLHSAGRLAARIAHQIKNPLAIINNASFSLQRSIEEGKNSAIEQIQIIREEVDRADRIITELMGYAQLAEGRVEKINVTEELDRAIKQVFPSAAKFKVAIHRDYMSALPALMMQKSHFAEIIVNLLQNAREAMKGTGKIDVIARHAEDFSVEIVIRDFGPGIPKEKLVRIFEPYFSTKEKGTGLGLAIVKHNVEIYGGAISVESELGKGAQFTLKFPAKSLMKLTQ
jgi:signal transduction histidine kinase